MPSTLEVGEPGALEEKHDLGREVHAHGEGVLLGGDAAAVGELLGADFEDKHLVERVDLERARAELELASGISSWPVRSCRRGSWHTAVPAPVRRASRAESPERPGGSPRSATR